MLNGIIPEGSIWVDLDVRSYYACVPGTIDPLPAGYVGEAGLAPRRVKAVAVSDDDRVVVENLHNGRRSKVKFDSFHFDPYVNNKPRKRGFVQ